MPKGRFFPAITVSLLVTGLTASARAEKSFLLSDFESGSAQNALYGSWYHFTDATNEGNSRVTTGDSVSGYWNETSWGEGYGGSQYSARIGFVFGDKSPSCGPLCTYDPEINIATDLYTVDTVQNLAGATHVSFAAKANTPVKVRFMVPTADVTDYAFYGQVIDIGTEWKVHSIALTASTEFAQPSWGKRVAFNLEKVQRFTFQVTKALNKTLASDTLHLDDVRIVGWEYTEPTALRPGSRNPGRQSASLAMAYGGRVRVSLAGAPAGRGGEVRLQDVAGRSLLQASYRPGQAAVDIPLAGTGSAGPWFVRILPHP